MMQRWYEDKAGAPDTTKTSWVTIVNGDAKPYLVQVVATTFEHIEHKCRVTTGSTGRLKRDGPDWVFEVTG